MKKLLPTLVTLFLLVSCGGTKTPEETRKEQLNKDKDAYIYGIESGVVELEYDQTDSKEITYFDRWGARRAIYTMQGDGEGNYTNEKIEIHIGADSYTVDMKTKKGRKLSNPFGQFSGSESSGYQESRQQRLAGAEKLADEKVGDKTCEVWDITMFEVSTRIYLYKGITLQNQIIMDGETFKSKLLRFEENAKVEAAKFDVPKDVVFQ